MITRKPLKRYTPLRMTKPMSRSREKKGPGLAQRVAQLVGTALGHKHSDPSVFRSEKHRRNVAALPCICCGKERSSQAAHLNLLALGKGMGLKLSDALTIPLCATSLGRIGCHAMLDSSGKYSKSASETLQITWLHQTRDRLIALDQWPQAAEADVVRFVGTFLRRAA